MFSTLTWLSQGGSQQQPMEMWGLASAQFGEEEKVAAGCSPPRWICALVP